MPPTSAVARHPSPTAYLIRHPRWIRFVYGLGICTWLSAVYGYVLFFQLNPWYWVIFGPIVGFFTVHHLLSYGINMFFPGFDLAAHHARVRAFRARPAPPAVDVFIPVCGEPLDILRRTFAAVAALDYPSRTTYVLDDKQDPAVRRLAQETGFSYLSRPNKGEHKKAGNLKHGHDRSTSPFIAYFDADFAPHPRFLWELLPAFDDPRVAIVQSPQHFALDDALHERAPVAFGAGHLQEDFYRVIQPARDRFGAAICVGTNAVYRRSALDAVGGVEQIDHSEDIITGFKLTRAGWKIRYVPLVLATGFCPEAVQTYFQQQHRWCKGTIHLCLSRDFWTAPIPLSVKLCYLSGFLYYLFQPLALVMVFQVFVLLLFHPDTISLRYALPFVPHLLFSFVLLAMNRTVRSRFGTFLARTTHVFSCTHAIMSHALGRSLEWMPSNNRPSGMSPAYLALLAIAAAHLGTQIGLTIAALSAGRWIITSVQHLPVTLWIYYHLVTGIIFFVVGARTLLRRAES